MSTRAMPTDCCRLQSPPEPLSEAEGLLLVTLFKALGDATRLEIFRLIASQSSAVCVCDITEHFQVSQPTISHHLKVLKEAGLITQSRRGVWSFYAPTGTGVAAYTQIGVLAPSSPIARSA